MNKELWQKAEELFHAALERAPASRQPFLEGTCGADTELREQVELLLAQEQKAGSFLEVPAIENMPVTLAASESLLGRQFGPYRIVLWVRRHGRGISGAIASSTGYAPSRHCLMSSRATFPDR
jgi:hypothetical protein